jgi:hypothetical protein
VPGVLLSALAAGLTLLAQAPAEAESENEAPRRSLAESIRETLDCLDPLRPEPAEGCVIELPEPGERSDLPRFEESIEVIGRSPEALLGRFLTRDELKRTRALSSAPSVQETQEYRPGPTQGANLMPVLDWLARKARGPSNATPRFYVYELLGRDGRWPVLRDRPLASSGFGTAGLTWTLVGAFPDWASARRVYEELRAECRTSRERE